MTEIARSRSAQRLAVALAVWMALSVGPGPAVVALAAAGRPETPVLVFPARVPGDVAKQAPPGLARWATAALQMAIDDLPGIACVDFSPSSPLVRKAVRDGKIRSVDVQAEVRDPRTAVEIGHALGVEVVALFEVQSYRLTTEPTQVEVSIVGSCYDVKQNFDEQTLQAKAQVQPLRTFAATGASKPRARYAGPEGVLAREALRRAAYKVAQQLAGVPPEQVTERPAPRRAGKARSWIIYLLAVAGLAILVSQAGDNKPARAVDADYMPGTPLLTANPAGQYGIQVRWNKPAEADNMAAEGKFLGYDLARRFAAPGSSSYSPPVVIATFSVLHGPDATTYLDINVQDGYAYMYGVRARYTDARYDPTPWVWSTPVTFNSP